MPYLFMLSLAVGLLIVTIVSGAIAQLGTRSVVILGQPHLLDLFSSRLLYLLGVAGEVFLLTAIYLVMPVGRLSLRHALIGGTAATLLWEITRHLLVWYLLDHFADSARLRIADDIDCRAIECRDRRDCCSAHRSLPNTNASATSRSTPSPSQWNLKGCEKPRLPCRWQRRRLVSVLTGGGGCAAEDRNCNGAIDARFQAWSGVTSATLVSSCERTSRLRE